MDAIHFDRLTMALGVRLTRRGALAGGIAGLSLLSGRLAPATAQNATPAAQASTPTTIYVQLADSGTWTVKSDDPGVYLLTLFDPGEQTLSFTMAPDRFVATIPTQDLLDSLGFTPENPPNAAVEVTTPTGARDVLVVELTAPVYTPASGDDDGAVLTYEARVLKAYKGTGLEEWIPDVDDDQLPTEFEQVSLFIDNGCWGFSGCYLVESDGSRGAKIGGVPSTPNLMRCPGFEPGTCVPCSGNSLATLHARCNEYYAACEGRCIAD
jgi:hypothetical protein